MSSTGQDSGAVNELLDVARTRHDPRLSGGRAQDRGVSPPAPHERRCRHVAVKDVATVGFEPTTFGL